ncbi:MAG: hypothetical protein NZZ41_07345, partial [Candidatus Dojkabacteria bacterium]|nr:hypothetical protein [Candidatus Dojkabacteria bacterium]
IGYESSLYDDLASRYPIHDLLRNLEHLSTTHPKDKFYPGCMPVLSGVGLKSTFQATISDLDFPLYALAHSIFMPASMANMYRYSYYSRLKINVTKVEPRDLDYSTSSGVTGRPKTGKYFAFIYGDTQPSSSSVNIQHMTSVSEDVEIYLNNAFRIAWEQGMQYKNHQYYAYFSPRIYPRAFAAYYTPTVNRPNPEYIPTDTIMYQEKEFKVKKKFFVFDKDDSEIFADVFNINVYNMVDKMRRQNKNFEAVSLNSLFRKIGGIAIAQRNNKNEIILDVYVFSKFNKVVPIRPYLNQDRKDLPTIIESKISAKDVETKDYTIFRMGSSSSNFEETILRIKKTKNSKDIYESMIEMREDFVKETQSLLIDDFIHPVEKGFKLGSALWDLKEIMVLDSNGFSIINKNDIEKDENNLHYAKRFFEAILVDHIVDKNKPNNYKKELSSKAVKQSVKLIIEPDNLDIDNKKKLGWSEGFYIKYVNNSDLKDFEDFVGKIDNLYYQIKKQKIVAPNIITRALNRINTTGMLAYVKNMSQKFTHNQTIGSTNYNFARFRDPRMSYSILSDRAKHSNDQYVGVYPIYENVNASLSTHGEYVYNRIIERAVFVLGLDNTISKRLYNEINEHSVDNTVLSNSYYTHGYLWNHGNVITNKEHLTQAQFVKTNEVENIINLNVSNIDRSKEPLFLVKNPEKANAFVMLFTNNKTNENPYAGFYSLNKTMYLGSPGVNQCSVSKIKERKFFSHDFRKSQYLLDVFLGLLTDTSKEKADIFNAYFISGAVSKLTYFKNFSGQQCILPMFLPRNVLQPFANLIYANFDYKNICASSALSLFNINNHEIQMLDYPMIYAKFMMPRIAVYMNQRFFTDELRGFAKRRVKLEEYVPRTDQQTTTFNVPYDSLSNEEKDIIDFTSFWKRKPSGNQLENT